MPNMDDAISDDLGNSAGEVSHKDNDNVVTMITNADIQITTFQTSKSTNDVKIGCW